MEENWYEILGVNEPEAEGGSAPKDGGSTLEEGAEGAEGADGAAIRESGDLEEGGSAPKDGGSTLEEGAEGADGAAVRESGDPEETEAQRMEAMEQRIRNEMKRAHDEELQAVFEALGLKDGDGNPISDMEAYRRNQEQAQVKKLERDLQSGKLTMEGLQAALSNLPGVKAVVDAAEKVTQEAGRDKFIAQREMQLAQIRKMNPNIKSINDIVEMSTGQEFLKAVNSGCDFVMAYKVANHEAIVKQARDAGAQSVRNAVAGKSHLRQTTNNVKGGVEVTQAMRDLYRAYKPNITDAEIAKAEALVNGKG